MGFRSYLLEKAGKKEGDPTIAVPAAMVPFRLVRKGDEKYVLVGSGHVGRIGTTHVLHTPVMGRKLRVLEHKKGNEDGYDTLTFKIDRVEGVVPWRDYAKEVMVAEDGVVVGFNTSRPYVSLMGILTFRVVSFDEGYDALVLDSSVERPDFILVRIINDYPDPYLNVAVKDDVLSSKLDLKKLEFPEGSTDVMVRYVLMRNSGDIYVEYGIGGYYEYDWIAGDILSIEVVGKRVVVRRKVITALGVVEDV